MSPITTSSEKDVLLEVTFVFIRICSKLLHDLPSSFGDHLLGMPILDIIPAQSEARYDLLVSIRRSEKLQVALHPKAAAFPMSWRLLYSLMVVQQNEDGRESHPVLLTLRMLANR